jgi:hypothetical protein
MLAEGSREDSGKPTAISKAYGAIKSAAGVDTRLGGFEKI